MNDLFESDLEDPEITKKDFAFVRKVQLVAKKENLDISAFYARNIILSENMLTNASETTIINCIEDYIRKSIKNKGK